MRNYPFQRTALPPPLRARAIGQLRKEAPKKVKCHKDVLAYHDSLLSTTLLPEPFSFIQVGEQGQVKRTLCIDLLKINL